MPSGVRLKTRVARRLDDGGQVRAARVRFLALGDVPVVGDDALTAGSPMRLTATTSRTRHDPSGSSLRHSNRTDVAGCARSAVSIACAAGRSS